MNIVSRVGDSVQQVGDGNTQVGETAQSSWRQVSYQLKTATAPDFIQNIKTKKQYQREHPITSDYLCVGDSYLLHPPFNKKVYHINYWYTVAFFNITPI